MRTIRLTESDLRTIVYESVTNVLQEMDKGTAIYPMTIFAATNNMTDNGVFHSKNRLGYDVSTNRANIKARHIADKAIMHYVIQEMKPTLSFRILDTNPTKKVGIEYTIEEIKEYTDEHMVFYGELISSQWNGYVDKHSTVKCVFGDKGKDGEPQEFKFFLIQNFGGNVKTPSIELLNDPKNTGIVKEIINNIYVLRQEAEANAASIVDLSGQNVNDRLVIKGKRK